MNKLLIELIKVGGVGVLGTDTLYGLVGSALSPEAVERIYNLRKRNKKKPMIILIGSLSDLKLFKVEKERLLNKIWPGKVSVILPCPYKKFVYLHRGTNSLAFRLPNKENLIRLLKKTGPLIAPSANLSGLKPAETIEEAKRYFKDKVDFYADEGKLSSLPSTLIAIENGEIILKRQGEVKYGKL